MSQPFSRRTLLTHGKIQEIAQICRTADIDAAVFTNALTPVQRTTLAKILNCLTLSVEDLTPNSQTAQRRKPKPRHP